MTQNEHVVGERLIGYLYDEVDAGERAAVAAHLSACAACASEWAGLGATRHQLAGWAPPDVALGFQITRATASTHEPAPAPSASVLRPTRWWRPLPAWAQAVAAAVIFAIGLALGGSWSRAVADQSAQSATSVAAGSAPVAGPANDSGVRLVTTPDAEGLAQQIATLRAEVAALRTATAAAPASRGLSEERVQQLVSDSEVNLRSELSLRLTQFARDVDLARRADREEIDRAFNVVSTQTATELRQQGQALRRLVNLSTAPPQ